METTATVAELHAAAKPRAGAMAAQPAAPSPAILPTTDQPTEVRAEMNDGVGGGSEAVSMVRIGAATVALYNIVLLALGPRIGLHLPPSAMFAYASGIAICLAFGAATYSSRFRAGWRGATVVFCALLVVVSAAASLEDANSDSLFLNLALLLIGTSALVPWGPRYQLALGAAAIAATLVHANFDTLLDANANQALIGVLFAALIAQVISYMADRYRRDIAGKVVELTASQERLHTEMRLREQLAIEREAVQRRVRESEANLRRVFESAPDIAEIARISDGAMVAVNRAFEQQFGRSRDRVNGRTIAETGLWVNFDERKRYEALILESGEVRNFEAQLRRMDGRVMPCLLAGSAIEFAGEPVILTFTRDITQSKQAAHELEIAREAALAASHAKSEFLSSMSHEIRTPLNAILGMSDLLGESELNPEQRHYLNVMSSNGTALLELINGILDIARIESGRLSLERTGFDLRDVLDKAVDGIAVRANEKHLELAVRVEPNIPTALIGDPLRLRQVLLNLLGNAVKFTESGEVLLTIESQPDGSDPAWLTLKFSVADTGIGIPEDKLGEIFVPFAQADSSTTRRFGGTGLGLSIVTRLVALMGGRVGIKSKVGQGSVFSFTAKFEMAKDALASEPAGEPDLGGVRILIVDDNATNRLILRETVNSRGAVATEAESGERALAEIQRSRDGGSPYDVMLLDFRMPGMDGFEVAKQAREMLGGSEMITIMLSSADLAAEHVDLARRRLDAYLTKPLRRREVLASIARVLARGSTALAASPAASAPESPVPDRPLRILIVDDSPDNRELVRAYLKKTPHLLDEAVDGRAGLDRFVAGSYDVVLMDIQMPVMDGYAATRAIRNWEHEHGAPRTPILALSASALNEAVEKTLEAGCDAHVSKPVKKATLLQAIADATRIQAQPPEVTRMSNANGAVHPGGLIVHVDRDLSDLIPGFLAHKADDARAVLAAVELHDFEAVQRLAHRLKGEGSSYGLDRVTELGRALGDAANRSDQAAARRFAEELADYLAHVEVLADLSPT
ncbi:MAG: response regulator [Candidatus Binataceae bacterium]